MTKAGTWISVRDATLAIEGSVCVVLVAIFVLLGASAVVSRVSDGEPVGVAALEDKQYLVECVSVEQPSALQHVSTELGVGEVGPVVSSVLVVKSSGLWLAGGVVSFRVSSK